MPADNSGVLFQGEDERGLYLRPEGEVRAPDCFPLRESVLQRLEGPAAPPGVVVDLTRCTYMDSTFVGLLVAIDRRLKPSGGRLRVVGPSAACSGILGGLGLDGLLACEPGPVEPPARLAPVECVGRPGAEFVLRTHEALMEASDTARRKFGLLKEALEQKVRAETGGAGGRPAG